MKKKLCCYGFIFLSSFMTFLPQVFAERKTVDQIDGSCGIIDQPILDFISTLWYYLLILGPVVFVIMSLVDIAKTISSSDDGAFKATGARILKRLIGLLLLIVLPVLINWVLGFVNESFSTCVS